MYPKRHKHEESKLGILVRSKPRAVDVSAAQFSGVVDLSEEQEKVVDRTIRWFSLSERNQAAPVWSIAGQAGTGKTCVTGFIAKQLCSATRRVAFCSPTGRAAGVLGRSLSAVDVRPMYCGTIHRMIYTPIVGPGGGIAGWSKKEKLDYDLVVVDEASMLSRDVLSDLMHYGVPVLLIGDDGQLSPVGDEGLPSVLSNPDCVLKTIHRQALNNPVLEFASLVRSGGDWRGMLRSSKDERLQKVSAAGLSMYVSERFKDRLDKPAAEDPLLLCGTNRMKKILNSAARIWLKDEVLVPGDRVVCLKNAYLSGALLANGFFGQVTSVIESRNPMQVRANISLPDEDLDLVEAILCKPQLTEDRTYSKLDEVPGDNFSWEDVGLLFSHGYALTGHRAQGGQRDEVIIYVEDFCKSDKEFRRWLYSTATRCIRSLKVAL